jgi:hypothetical protein
MLLFWQTVSSSLPLPSTTLGWRSMIIMVQYARMSCLAIPLSLPGPVSFSGWQQVEYAGR